MNIDGVGGTPELEVYIEEGIDSNSVGEDEKLSCMGNEHIKSWVRPFPESLHASFVKWGKLQFLVHSCKIPKRSEDHTLI